MKNEIIVLIHGLGRTSFSMSLLKQFLHRQGYTLYNYSYPSTKYQIFEHTQQFLAFIDTLINKNPDKKISFIGHSLGGIISKEALSKLPEDKLKNCRCLIQLASPNQGSPAAKLSMTLAPRISSYIKPLAELSSDKHAYVHKITVPKQIRVGVIAGKYDAKVPPTYAQLTAENEFLLVNTTHTFIMNHPKTRKAILNFIQKASFE